MTIKQLQYFISVADHLNFTRAAKDHYISQTAISQQIKNLESMLGFKLFIRTKQSVALTTSGHVFYNDAKSILKNLGTAIRKASMASTEYVGNISIGFLEGYKYTELPKIISKLKVTYPNICFQIIRGNIDELYIKLENKELDLVFGYALAVDSYPNITNTIISSCPLCVVLYNSHPLSKKSQVTASELINEEFIFVDKQKSPFAYNAVIAKLSNWGFTPNVIHTVDSTETSLLMVKSQLGITILPKLQESYKSQDISFIPIENEVSQLTLSWSKNNTDIKLNKIINTITNKEVGE